MLIRNTTISFFILFITGCSSTGNVNQNKTASRIVNQVDQSYIERPDFKTLISSFEDNSSSSPYSGSVVELSGKVVAFSLTEDGLYIVTIRKNKDDVLCVFDESLANELGTGKSIHNGANITVHGQCYASGLFSSNVFTLDGCKLVSK
jgi:hypothetical protein